LGKFHSFPDDFGQSQILTHQKFARTEIESLDALLSQAKPLKTKGYAEAVLNSIRNILIPQQILLSTISPRLPSCTEETDATHRTLNEKLSSVISLYAP
jgi:hypothetical protein